MKLSTSTSPSVELKVAQIPSEHASLHDLIEFAHTFDGFRRWGSFEKCAEIANAQDHSSIDRLRTCLFFEARRWRHFGEEPDNEALVYWRSLVIKLRERIDRIDSATVAWLAIAIHQLPSDPAVPRCTQGYNKYLTQKDHWLGWLNPAAGTGTYPRRTGKNTVARTVYNRIGEPKMLLWLSEASEVDTELIAVARETQRNATSLSGQCAAIRRAIPWQVVAEALLSRQHRNAA